MKKVLVKSIAMIGMLFMAITPIYANYETHDTEYQTYTQRKEYTGFKTIGEKTYYFKEGKKLSGQHRIHKHWYYFDEVTNVMVKGWKEIPSQNKRIYYDEKGRMVKGWFTVNNVDFYANEVTGNIEITQHTNIPYYCQADGAWGNVYIGGFSIASTGCGATIGTSIINYYTCNTYTPVDVGNMFHEWKHYNSIYGHGTDSGVWRLVSEEYGLNFRNGLTVDTMKEELRKGNVIAAAVARGYFVDGNYTHFVLLHGLDNDGNTWVYDPLSPGRNGLYSAEAIFNQQSWVEMDRLDEGPFISLGLL